MSRFAVPVVRIEEPVVDHPNADRLSLVKIRGFMTVTQKQPDGSHAHQQGDHVVYIPEGAIVPEWLLKSLGFWRPSVANPQVGAGALAGERGDRVHAVRLRGIVSQGIVMSAQPVGMALRIKDEAGDLHYVVEGQDVAAILGITKHQPEIPESMRGQVKSLFGHTLGYDIESIQNVPTLFTEGEYVAVTEKIHGIQCQIGWLPDVEDGDLFDVVPGQGCFYTSSKGLGAEGLAFMNVAANDRNHYVGTLRNLIDVGFTKRVRQIDGVFGPKGSPIHIFGEIFGPGVQDMHYGQETPRFRVFDVAVNGRFLPSYSYDRAWRLLAADPVPLVYFGPFWKDILPSLRDRPSHLFPRSRAEGIVIRAATGDDHPFLGRKIAKMVSPDYLLRKNGTEYT